VGTESFRDPAAGTRIAAELAQLSAFSEENRVLAATNEIPEHQ
jgi:hypothetical protein